MTATIPATFLAFELLATLLVPQLGDRSYRRRASASAALAACGRLSLPALERAAAGHDPETRARAAVLLRPYARELARRQADRLIGPDCPPVWVGWLAGPDHTEAMREACGRSDGPDWFPYAGLPDRRAATRLWVRSQILQRRPRAWIAGQVEAMRRTASLK